MQPSKRIETYVTPSGKDVFEEWFEDLRDERVRAAIKIRLDRLMHGNPGDYKYLGEGVYELRIHFGAGYRLYYGEEGPSIIILLCGGDKSTQHKDIAKAKGYWREHRSAI